MSEIRNSYLNIDNAKLFSAEFAKNEDEKDELSRLRAEFIIPTKGDLKNKKFGFRSKNEKDGGSDIAPGCQKNHEDSIYLCGNSLGLQPQRTKEYVNRYLDTWASKGVFGHFSNYDGGLPPWLHIDDAIKDQTAKMVGALPSEVVIMETLTANLHLLMASFYRPTKDRWKIIIEGKAFPSDHVRSYETVVDIYRYVCELTSGSMLRSPKSLIMILIPRHSLLLIRRHHLRHICPMTTFFQR